MVNCQDWDVFIKPMYERVVDVAMPGSLDVGDISWVTPTG
jgi:hypothetical protein